MVHIQELFAAGVHSRTIAGLMPCMRDSDGGPAESATPKLVESLTEERERLDGQIRDLTNSRVGLDDVIAAASQSDGSARAEGPRETVAESFGAQRDKP